MTAKQYDAAIKLSTMTALKGGGISLPEIIGVLELAKINAERMAYEAAKDNHQMNPKVIPFNDRVITPG